MFLFKASGRLEQSGEDMLEGMQAVICDPQYNTCRISERLNSEHFWLSVQDMRHFIELLSAVMYLGAHAHLFRSALHFRTWYELLVDIV